MAHNHKFNKSLTTVLGKSQALEGIPEALATANSIIAINPTYDPNIESNSEALAGGALDRNTVVSITDNFAEISFGSYLPVLGSLLGKQVGVTESHFVTIDASLNEATDSDVLVLGGITLTVKPGQTMTSAQVVSNFVAYANASGTPSATLATYSGTLSTNYSVQAVQVGTTAIWGLLFTGVQPYTDLGNITATGSAVATLGKITIDSANGSTTLSNQLPIGDFLEASNLAQVITTDLGLRDTLDAQFTSALTYIAAARTLSVQGAAGVIKTRKLATLLAKLDLGDSANTTLVNTFIADLTALLVQLNNDTNGSLDSIKSKINILYSTFNAHIAAGEYNLAIKDIKDDAAELLDMFTDSYQTLTNVLKVGDSLTFAGRSYTALANTNGNQLINIIINQGASPYAAQVTIATVSAPIIARWTLSASTSISKVRATKVGVVAATDKTDLTAVITKLPGSTSNLGSLLEMSPAFTITTIDDNLVAYTADMNAIVNDNSAIQAAYSELRSQMIQAFAATKTLVAAIPAKITAGTNSAYSVVNAANTTVSASTWTIADLVPVYKSVTFTNSVASPSTMTCHTRKSSPTLVNEEKTVIIVDAKFTIDLDVEVSKRPMVKFNGHGNIYDIVNTDSIVYDIATQQTNAAPVTTSDNIRNASLTPTGEGIYSNNICFNKLSASNIDGFNHTRTLTGCGDFWQATPKAHDFTVTVLEEAPDTIITDSLDIEKAVGQEFTFYFEQGIGVGKNLSVKMTKCILKGYKHSDINNTAAQDLTLECGGTTEIRLF